MLNNEQEANGLTGVAIRRVNEIKNEFQTAHYQQEAERKYNKMMMVRHKSAYSHRKQELIELFNESGLCCDEDMSDDELRALISQLPQQEEMEALLLEKLRAIYKEFPVSSNYMERIVRHLCDPDFRDETVRVAIVKQFMRYTDYETGDFKRRRGKVIELVKQIKGESAIEKAFDGKANIADKYERYREAVISLFDEAVFDLYDTTYNTLNKDAKEKFNLLKLADGLANGKFWMNFGTRRDLYLFAFAFNMRAYPDKTVDDYNKDLDIEEKLFFDFYADNLLRSLTVSPGTEEREPSGEGINYKNFAEIIYLYYLNNNQLQPGEKIKRADKTIEECVGKVEEREKKCHDIPDARLPGNNVGKEDTNAYKEYYYSEVMQLDETRLADYIVEHYEIPKDVRRGSRIAVANEEITATKKYKELREKLLALLADDQRLTEIFMPEINVKESLGEGSKIGIEMQDIEETLRSVNETLGNDKDFVKILTVLDNRLKIDVHNDAILKGTERMTRTRLIALHYLNYINEMADEETIHQGGVQAFAGEGKSLAKIYDDFVHRVDRDLEEARYQKISPKNIYDMFVIFMLYRYFALI